MTGRVGSAIKAGQYREVARVECATLEEVFPLTNHIDHNWTENTGITQCADDARSTSIGDLVKDTDDGLIYACKLVGWELISMELANAFADHIEKGVIDTLEPPQCRDDLSPGS